MDSKLTAPAICPCGAFVPKATAYKRRKNGDVVNCRKCRHGSKMTKESKAAKKRDELLRRLYDLTLETFAEMFAAQGSCCAICGSTDPQAVNWHVDHCHDTGRVRGILCGTCNKGLGHFRDDPALLVAATGYLLENS